MGWEGRKNYVIEYLEDEERTHRNVLSVCTKDQLAEFRRFMYDRKARYNKYSLHRYCDKFVERLDIMKTTVNE